MSEEAAINALREIEHAKVTDRMRAAGVPNSGVGSLIEMDVPESGVAVLLSLMKEVTHPSIKQGVIRALATPSAKGASAKSLIEYFECLPDTEWASQDTKWVIGNTLYIIADASVASDLLRIAADKRHGKSREMIVYSLGRFRSPRVTEVLLTLANDPEVYGHAIMALGNSGDVRAIPVVQSKLEDKRSWVRAEARKALKKLQRSTQTK